MKIVDLTVTIGRDTYSPPSVNQPIGIEGHHEAPGLDGLGDNDDAPLRISVDFAKHYTEDGENAESVLLEPACGEAVIVDLSPLEPDHDISPTALDSSATEIRPGNMVLIGTVWSDQAGRWLVDTGPRRSGSTAFLSGLRKAGLPARRVRGPRDRG